MFSGYKEAVRDHRFELAQNRVYSEVSPGKRRMRITGVKSKGRILFTPKGMDMRPSSDRVREAVFSILGQDLSGTAVLDLFSGTGSLGLEALSRCGRFAVFIDKALRAIETAKKNLAVCGYQQAGTVLRRDLRKGLPLNHPAMQHRFDLIFMDPPYGKNLLLPLAEKILAADILSLGARVVMESSKTEQLPHRIGNLQLVEDRIYGDTRIHIFSCEVLS